MRRIGRGDPVDAPIPPRLLDHVIARAYGTTLEAVRAWPADDYADAVTFLPATNALTGGLR